MSSHLKAELAATCTTLGRLHKGEYLIEPECIESVKDLIRYLKRDNDTHDIRRYLGESKVLQNDLIHIVRSCPDENSDLFDVTLRLLINLTTPSLLFYGEEIPAEKTARNIYLNLTSYTQEYKSAFCDVQFWNKICGKLSDLFEIDWAERSAEDGIQIERILMLLRNVLQVPADIESEKRPDNDITVHDKVLWALRQSQILELLLFVSSNNNEEQYYLNLLEIFSLILREQNPKLLARCDIHRSAAEKSKDSEELARVRESEKKTRNNYLNMRNFNATFVMKGVKSLSNNDVVCHTSLGKVSELDVGSISSKKVVRTRRNRVPVQSERMERRSTFSVRLFLKEFCLEFLNGAFNHLMNVIKSRLDCGKSLPNDQTYYFWAVKFFLDFATASDSDVVLIKDFLSTESFHFVQTSMENALEHMAADKKKTVEWVRRIHLILKTYYSLLETLLWMDLSKNPLIRSESREIKSQIFYVVEYREMTLHLLLKYDPSKFSESYLRDLIETTHLFVKLLEEYSKQTKLVVQKVTKKKTSRKKSKKSEPQVETGPEKWEKIKDNVYDSLCSERTFPEIPPFDAALDIPIDDQRSRAMKRIQMFLHEGMITDAIGLLRSSRQVWPENDYFGTEEMSMENEMMALQEICVADLGKVDGGSIGKDESYPEPLEDEDADESERFEDESRIQIVEQDFDIMDFKKRLVNKRVVEGCGILLRNYKKNSDHTNHCVIKLLHRVGWECCMPALLFQASLFWSLLKIMRDRSGCYKEINTFTMNLMRKFRKHAVQNPVVFLELLFWKENNVALEIQHGYQEYEEKAKPSEYLKNGKEQMSGDKAEGTGRGRVRRARKSKAILGERDQGESGTKRKKTRKQKTNETEVLLQCESLVNFSGDENVVSSEGEESVRGDLSSVCRILLDNNSESYEDKGSEVNQKITTLDGVGASGRLTLTAEQKSVKEREMQNEIVKNVKVNSKRKPRRQRIIESSDEESYDEEAKNVSSNLIHRFTDGNSSSNEEVEEVEDKSKTPERPKQCDEQTEHSEMDRTNDARSGTEMGRHNFTRGKDISDVGNNNNSQISNSSSKKRVRGKERDTGHFSEDSDGSILLKSTKVRCIGSDSEMENSEWEEGSVSKSNRRRARKRRLAIIDSDSDFETNSLDEK